MTTPRGGLNDIKLVEYDAAAAEARVVADLEEALQTSLSTADPRRIIALALCQSIIQTSINADHGAKQTLLSYATGEALDHLGYYMKVNRPQATRATCTATFTRSTSGSVESVPAGLVCKGGDLEWTAEAFSFAANSLTATNVTLTCSTAGTIGNGVAIGQVNTVATPSLIVSGVTNTTASHGAIDESDDDAYAELIRLSTDAFSVAGPIGAYEYHAKAASPDILDIHVVSPEPAQVTVYVIATGGVAPSAGVLSAVTAALSADTVRPVGDRVTVSAPTAVSFTPNATYYIDRETAARQGEANVKTACEAAYSAYIEWQRSSIGRDIVPDKLVQMLLSAGAKRVTTSMQYTSISAYQWAVPSNGALTYGGVEDE